MYHECYPDVHSSGPFYLYKEIQLYAESIIFLCFRAAERKYQVQLKTAIYWKGLKRTPAPWYQDDHMRMEEIQFLLEDLSISPNNLFSYCKPRLTFADLDV